MAYKTTLEMAGKKYDVLSASWAFNRSVDAKGKPSSGVYGGEISLMIESSDDVTIMETMLNSQTKAQKGTITFDKGTADGQLKKLEFVDGFITSYSEGIQAGGADAGTISFVITARKFQMGNAVHENEWPGHAAGS